MERAKRKARAKKKQLLRKGRTRAQHIQRTCRKNLGRVEKQRSRALKKLQQAEKKLRQLKRKRKRASFFKKLALNVAVRRTMRYGLLFDIP